MKGNAVFEDAKDVIALIKRGRDYLSPIRLQKALYFLFAYYGATYGSIPNSKSEEERASEVDDNLFPKYLFNEYNGKEIEFEAWQYGPVIRPIYADNKENMFENISFDEEKYKNINIINDVILFVNDIMEELDSMSDFSLVDRSHQDLAWRSKFNIDDPYRSNVIDKDELIAEYINTLNEASRI